MQDDSDVPDGRPTLPTGLEAPPDSERVRDTEVPPEPPEPLRGRADIPSPLRPPRGSVWPSRRTGGAPASREPTEPKAKPLVLVADDERMTRNYVSDLLRKHDFEVETVDNGQHAVDRVARGGVDVVLLDIVMPGIDGTHACRLIKGLPFELFVPVILLTGKSDPDSRVEGLRIGADDYVTKPFDQRELLARVHAMLRIKQGHDEVTRAKQRLARLAVRDALTDLYNYRYLQTRLNEEFKRAERYRDPLGCVMIDVDRFRAVNDRHGPEAGDRALRAVAERLTSSVREIDVVTRYGGEEFLIVLPSTHFSGALTVANRVWRAVRDAPFDVGGEEVPLTVSLGVALFPSRDIKSKDQLLRAADRALFQAKEGGADRICVFQHQEYMYDPQD